MQAQAYWKAVTADTTDLLDRVIGLLEVNGIRYCLVGGQAVNAYVEPVVSLDLDIVVAADQLEQLEALLSRDMRVDRFPHSLNVPGAGSDLRVRFQTDARYFPFVERCEEREVLGRPFPVASAADVLLGKVWAASDPRRRASKRQKDLADIARLIEAYPELRGRVPQDLLDRLI